MDQQRGNGQSADSTALSPSGEGRDTRWHRRLAAFATRHCWPIIGVAFVIAYLALLYDPDNQTLEFLLTLLLVVASNVIIYTWRCRSRARAQAGHGACDLDGDEGPQDLTRDR